MTTALDDLMVKQYHQINTTLGVTFMNTAHCHQLAVSGVTSAKFMDLLNPCMLDGPMIELPLVDLC